MTSVMRAHHVVVAGLLLAGCKKDRSKTEPAPPPAAAATTSGTGAGATPRADLALPPDAAVAAAPAAAPDAGARARAIAAAKSAGILGVLSKQGGNFASITGTGDFTSGFDDRDIQGGLLGSQAGDPQGGWGFGTSGSGVGGGGSGTIGTGRYGTIGRGGGLGTGSGYGMGGGGGMTGRAAAAPRLRLGSIVADGGLDVGVVRRLVRRHLVQLTYCYQKVLLSDPKLAGTVQVHLAIARDGRITPKVSGLDARVAACMSEVLARMAAPSSPDGPTTADFTIALVPN